MDSEVVKTAHPSGTTPSNNLGQEGRRLSAAGIAADPNRIPLFLIALVLTAAILLVYGPVKEFEFLVLDDTGYVTENVHVRTGLTWQNLGWAFTTSEMANWHQVTWLSHMADCQLFGLNAGAHHQTNVILNVVNTLVLLLLLSRMTGDLWKSAFVAALFALHPLHVESVAWISERKDLLSACFGFLAIYFYIPYARTKRSVSYVCSLCCFALSLMAKPMMVTLPFLLLLFDFWPLARIKPSSPWNRDRLRELTGLVKEKIPFFGLSVLSSIMTVLAQGWGGAIKPLETYPASVRFFNAIVAYIWYPIKTLWPRQLVAYYPHPGFGLGFTEIFGSLTVLVGISYLVVRYARQHPYLFVGWFSYLGMLVPVIGLVQVGSQGMADRYSYVPLIGLFLMAAWGIPELLAGLRHRKTLLWCGGILTLAVLSLLSARQVGYWRNSTVLFERALALTDGNARAHSCLGQARFQDGRIAEAIFHYRESIRIHPEYHVVHTNMAKALYAAGNIDGARYHLERSIRLYPKNPVASTNLAIILLADGDSETAIALLRKAVEDAPDKPKAREILAQTLLESGDPKEAEAHLRHALRYTSTPRDSRVMLARSLLAQHRPVEAIDLLTRQLNESPDDADALGHLGEALVKAHRAAAAVAVLEHQLTLGESADVRNNLGIALAHAGRLDEAVRQLSEAVRLAPENEVFQNNLESIQRANTQNE